MPQSVSLYRILIASPGDCTHERELVPLVIANWNAVHSKDESAVVEAVMWETHARPALGDRPQGIINRQLVQECDAIIGTFWTRLGTPTGIAESGTAEEIEQFRTAGKPVLLYFSTALVNPASIDIEQYKALTSYRNKMQSTGLYFEYSSITDLQEKLQRHIAATMVDLLRSGFGKEVVSVSEQHEATQSLKAGATDSDNETIDELPVIHHDSIEFFARRIGRSFPGVRGLEWFNSPETAVDRLMIMLREPMEFRVAHNEDNWRINPIWWFRAGSSMFIKEVERLGATKILMDNDELEVKRIAVFESARWYQCFVYVEVYGEPQTGVYNYSESQTNDFRSSMGYADEEYALLGEHAIKRTEYDDGAAVIDGKVVDADDARLRTRYLTDYNFIITSQDSPFNSNKFDAGSGKMLDGILNGSSQPEELFEWLMSFNKHED